jgi:hypothetical protein
MRRHYRLHPNLARTAIVKPPLFFKFRHQILTKAMVSCKRLLNSWSSAGTQHNKDTFGEKYDLSRGSQFYVLR